jgi:nucleoid DNA-binding protein|tara:strand:- start:80 stop:364 length:285 start_codon:yes stop_codon:yes gene_type:complete
LSRPELIKQLKQKNPELNQSDLETVIDTFCESIEKALKNNSYIELRDFGTFFVKKIKEKHSARNPKTGELIYVPEKNKVRFRASKKLKEFINNE